MDSIRQDVLEELLPLVELPEHALRQLAEEAEVEDHGARSVIFRKGGDDGWLRYVLSGAVVLVDDQGHRRTFTGTGDGGVYPEPLAGRRPYPHHAVASTDVRLIRLPQERVEALLDLVRPPGYDVDELQPDVDDPGAGLFYRLIDDLMSDRLDLPSMPNMALRVRQAVEQEDASASEIAKIIQADPALAARLIQIANSPAYGGQGTVDSLTVAITRLGLKATREMVLAVTLRSLFTSEHPLIHQRMTELWMHSALVAAICQVMAKRLDGFNPQRALLAGLVHDIGIIPMLANAHRYPALIDNPGKLQDTVSDYRDQVGAMILRRWNFPDDLVDVPLAAEQWQRRVVDADYADLVIVAQLRALASVPGDDIPELTATSAWRRLRRVGNDLGDDGDSILAEAREEIAQVQHLLLVR